MRILHELKGKKLPLFFLCTYIGLVPIINTYLKLLEESFERNYHSIDVRSISFFTIPFKNGIITSIWLISSIIILLLIKNIRTTIKNSKIEIEGINLKKKDGTYGTADWATKEEMKEYLSIGKKDGIILGKTEQNEIITLPLNTILNKNIAVFGSSGSKKSRRFCNTKHNGII